LRITGGKYLKEVFERKEIGYYSPQGNPSVPLGEGRGGLESSPGLLSGLQEFSLFDDPAHGRVDFPVAGQDVLPA
jgi:hypothetical protein